MARGYRVLLDRDGLTPLFRRALGPLPQRAGPSEQEYRDLYATFAYHAIWIAKKLRRGELWVAAQGCNADLRGMLLTMLEWQSIAEGRDPWPSGRFFEHWAPAHTVPLLPGSYADYEAGSIRHALTLGFAQFFDAAQAVARLGRFDSPWRWQSIGQRHLAALLADR